jgi:hypothetical protein
VVLDEGLRSFWPAALGTGTGISLMRRKPFLPQLTTIVLLAMWCLSCGRSAAEVRLSGTQDRIVLQTKDATIAEILAALRSAFDLEVTLEGATARRFTGVYSGSLRRVISRLLTGENYVIGSAADGLSIRLLGGSAAHGTAAPSAPLPAASGSRFVALRQARGRAPANTPP